MVRVSSSLSDNVDDRLPSRDRERVRDLEMANENVADAVAATRVPLKDNDSGERVEEVDNDGKGERE